MHVDGCQLFWLSWRSQVIWTTVRATWRPSMTLTTTSFSPNFKIFWSQITSGSIRYRDRSESKWKQHLYVEVLTGWHPQVNLNKPCPFWTTSSHCGLRDCAVKPCSPVSSFLPILNTPALFRPDPPEQTSVHRTRYRRVWGNPPTTRSVCQLEEVVHTSKKCIHWGGKLKDHACACVCVFSVFSSSKRASHWLRTGDSSRSRKHLFKVSLVALKSADGKSFWLLRDDENLLWLRFSNETREALLNWNRHDDEAERFCVVDGNSHSNHTVRETPRDSEACAFPM